MKNIDSIDHVTGKSIYVDDIPELQGTLFAYPVLSTVAHARILKIDFDKALSAEGVVAIYTASDIDGENQIGGIIPDETLFAEDEVDFIGQPIAIVVANNHHSAKMASKLVNIDYAELDVITDPRDAKEKGQLLFPPRTFAIGNTVDGFNKCKYVFSGRADSGGQEHLYIETQGSFVIPSEKNKLLIYSSTQGPTLVQKIAAKVLDLSMSDIEVDVRRLGGAFGGKEDQATAWVVMAALAARKLNRPVKLILDREQDMIATGKRHPYSSDFKIGLDEGLKIKAFEVTYYQNGGAATDLSPAIMERTLFHVTNAYYIPNVVATAYSCKTNITPFTAFRGFGGPQAMFVIESAISLAASEIGVDKEIIQRNNLLSKGDQFHYGQLCDSNNALSSWASLEREFEAAKVKATINDFNKKNTFQKMGMAIMPICFGISFTKTPMNQARALVHIYQDGSIGISTGAVEMGQGVNTKMIQIAASVFSVKTERVKIETTNTTRVANTSPTAASSGADLNGNALLIACNKLLNRLRNKAAEIIDISVGDIVFRNERVMSGNSETNLTWEQLVETAFLDREKLSEVGHYATPVIHFDKTIEKGHPFAYHVYGAAAITVKLDCISGVYEIEDVKIVHDFGNSLNPDIDTGQVEGAVVQGIGWMTSEELKWDDKARLMASTLSTYKVPDVFAAPKRISSKPLIGDGSELAILKSKAVGEPPFMYGIGAYFALEDAIAAFNPDLLRKYDAPNTPEKVLLKLYKNQ